VAYPHVIPSCEMRMLAAKLSGDMAASLRQASKAEKEALSDDNVCEPGTSCDTCSDQIVAAFKASECNDMPATNTSAGHSFNTA